MAKNYKTRHDSNEVPFEHGDKTLVFSSYDGTFYNYNLLNVNGNYRGTYQSKVKLH